MGSQNSWEGREVFMIVKTLITSFLLTIILELTVALIWKIRDKKSWYVILLVNLITNPLVVMVHIWGRYLLIPNVLQVLTVLIEIVVWGLEGFLYSRRLNVKHPYWFAVAANAVSYGCGVLVQFVNVG